MAQIHNLLIRALNSIYNQCLLPSTPSQTASFLHYCRVFTSILHHHHEIEDTWLFPEFERLLAQPGAMAGNVEEHDAFLPGLTLFDAYVSKTRPEEYCGMTLRNMLERFAPLLVEHLHEEIPTILGMWKVEAKELEKCWAVAEKMGRSGGSVWEAPAMILACVDKEMVMDGEACTFPDAPGVVEWVVRKGLSRRFAEVWRWAPFGMDGVRRVVRS
jgi:hemerythrin-like domain-containing protein